MRRIRNRGFTLIETLVATVLVAFLVAGAAEIIGLALLTKKKAEVHIEATAIIQNKLERLRALPFGAPELDPGLYREAVAPKDGPGAFVCEWMIEDLPGRLKRVGITVSGPAGPAAEAVLLISGDLGFGS